MSQRFIAHYIDEERFQEFLRTRKPFDFNYTPSLKIEPIEQYDAFSFRCFFLETKPHSDYSKPENWQYVSEYVLTSRSYIIDFLKQKTVYITTDGIAFYKMLDYRVDEHLRLQVHLRQVQNMVYTDHNRAFMVMPFGKLDDFYKTTIMDYLHKELNITVNRADDFTDNDIIVDTIYREIEKSEFIICEISECNKNVFYEIGYAKAREKNLIFLLQRGMEHKFFDVSHIRRIEYDLDNPIELQAKLKDTILTIRGRG